LNLDLTATTIFVALFLLVAWLGFAAARWRKADLNLLHEWGLGGRRFGTIVTWFLLGGDLYTAYTFIAVPALVFGKGAMGFFAVPYTILVYPILYLVFPRVWIIAHERGHLTAADFVGDRFGSRLLALAVAVTGILATMPYIALQLVGMEVVIGALGFPQGGLLSHAPLIIALLILAAFTRASGLRAPALIAIVKDLLIFITIIAAVVVIPAKLGGFSAIFAAVPQERLLLTPPGGDSLGAYSAYATLALGSALALFLYPHSMTGVLSSSSGNVIRRNAALLSAYSFVLGLIALLGYMALAVGVDKDPAYAAEEARIAKIASLVVKLGAVVFVLTLPHVYAIELQLLGGIWIIQLLPPVLLGLYARSINAAALLVGWAAGIGTGTYMAATQGLASSIFPLAIFGVTIPGYAALYSVLINFLLAMCLSPIVDLLTRRRATSAAR
jgi:SSS family solute:Na+ symporter